MRAKQMILASASVRANSLNYIGLRGIKMEGALAPRAFEPVNNL